MTMSRSSCALPEPRKVAGSGLGRRWMTPVEHRRSRPSRRARRARAGSSRRPSTVPSVQTPASTTRSRRSCRYSTSVTSSSSVDRPATRRSAARSSRSSWSPSKVVKSVSSSCQASSSARAVALNSNSSDRGVILSLWVAPCVVLRVALMERAVRVLYAHSRADTVCGDERADRPLLHRRAGQRRRAPHAGRHAGRAPGQVQTAPGVFCPDRLDVGTAVLLQHVPAPPATGAVLDLGCGWGPIALTLGLLSPGASVWAVDVNQRALDLARHNAARARPGGRPRLHARGGAGGRCGSRRSGPTRRSGSARRSCTTCC